MRILKNIKAAFKRNPKAFLWSLFIVAFLISVFFLTGGEN